MKSNLEGEAKTPIILSRVFINKSGDSIVTDQWEELNTLLNCLDGKERLEGNEEN